MEEETYLRLQKEMALLENNLRVNRLGLQKLQRPLHSGDLDDEALHCPLADTMHTHSVVKGAHWCEDAEPFRAEYSRRA